MSNLILIKHSLPEIVPGMPSQRWQLSKEGITRCTWLGESLSSYDIERVVSSAEPKAEHTARHLATSLGLSNMVYRDLHENDRMGIPFLEHESFERLIKTFFAKADEIVMGRESAQQAQKRFADEIGRVLIHGQGTVAVVAHGTVNTLFTMRHNSIIPFELWKSLKLPSYIVLDRTDFSWDGKVHNYPIS